MWKFWKKREAPSAVMLKVEAVEPAKKEESKIVDNYPQYKKGDIVIMPVDGGYNIVIKVLHYDWIPSVDPDKTVTSLLRYELDLYSTCTFRSIKAAQAEIKRRQEPPVVVRKRKRRK